MNKFLQNAHQDQIYHHQRLSFLATSKCVGETISLSEQMHVNVVDQSALWKVNEDVIAFFCFAKAISYHQQRNCKINSCSKIHCISVPVHFLLLKTKFRFSKSKIKQQNQDLSKQA